MSLIQSILNIILHLSPTTLGQFMHNYGVFAYIVVFLIIFCETGLVVTPFLPGDSLIFALGALAALGVLNWPTLIMLIFAAVLGNMLNYQIGKFLSVKVKSRQKIRFIKMEYIDDTHKYFEKYGPATIIITRFMPIIRTFAPFVAGVGEMPYLKFFIYNFIGGTLWASFFFVCGFSFGKIPAVSEHFTTIIGAIVLVSVMPAVIIFFIKRFKKNTTAKTPEE